MGEQKSSKKVYGTAADEYNPTFSAFLCDNKGDFFNLVLGQIFWWVYGFRTVFTCGYTSYISLSQYYCSQISGSGYQLENSAPAPQWPTW